MNFLPCRLPFIPEHPAFRCFCLPSFAEILCRVFGHRVSTLNVPPYNGRAAYRVHYCVRCGASRTEWVPPVK